MITNAFKSFDSTSRFSRTFSSFRKKCNSSGNSSSLQTQRSELSGLYSLSYSRKSSDRSSYSSSKTLVPPEVSSTPPSLLKASLDPIYSQISADIELNIAKSNISQNHRTEKKQKNIFYSIIKFIKNFFHGKEKYKERKIREENYPTYTGTEFKDVQIIYQNFREKIKSKEKISDKELIILNKIRDNAIKFLMNRNKKDNYKKSKIINEYRKVEKSKIINKCKEAGEYINENIIDSIIDDNIIGAIIKKNDNEIYFLIPPLNQDEKLRRQDKKILLSWKNELRSLLDFNKEIIEKFDKEMLELFSEVTEKSESTEIPSTAFSVSDYLAVQQDVGKQKLKSILPKQPEQSKHRKLYNKVKKITKADFITKSIKVNLFERSKKIDVPLFEPIIKKPENLASYHSDINPSTKFRLNKWWQFNNSVSRNDSALSGGKFGADLEEEYGVIFEHKLNSSLKRNSSIISVKSVDSEKTLLGEESSSLSDNSDGSLNRSKQNKRDSINSDDTLLNKIQPVPVSKKIQQKYVPELINVLAQIQMSKNSTKVAKVDFKPVFTQPVSAKKQKQQQFSAPGLANVLAQMNAVVAPNENKSNNALKFLLKKRQQIAQEGE